MLRKLGIMVHVLFNVLSWINILKMVIQMVLQFGGRLTSPHIIEDANISKRSRGFSESSGIRHGPAGQY